MDTTDFSCDSDLLFDDLDVIRKRLSLPLNTAHSSPNTSHMEDDAPAGLRVMLVDDNTARLFLTSIMLKKFNHEVMSGDIKAEMVTRALENGDGHYLYKPVTYSDFEKLWKHIIKSKVDPKGYEKHMEQTQSFCQDSPREKQKSTSRAAVSASRKRKEPSREQPGDGKRTRARSAAPKKRRVIWTAELHNHFLDAIEALGVDKGVPKRILEYMRIPGLTRENVASHLQVCLQVIFLVSKIKHDMKIYFFLIDIPKSILFNTTCMYLSSYTRCIRKG
ncbi:hypothetical protein MKW92_029435 [Papaver armeniacum]|nr:hypothetical protein MKW92_029435 [Papaver armeniacum]